MGYEMKYGLILLEYVEIHPVKLWCNSMGVFFHPFLRWVLVGFFVELHIEICYELYFLLELRSNSVGFFLEFKR